MLNTFPIYLGIGVTAGLMGGLLGVGGGLVVVPALSFVFMSQHFSHSLSMHLAAGTSLASICATALASTYTHSKYKAVLWPKVKALAPGIIAGAMSGAVLSGWLHGDAARILFSIFVFITAAQLWWGLKPSPKRHFPGSVGATVAGATIGGISGFIGIGGGSLIVPYLIWCNLSVREAIATSSACGLPLAMAGTLGFVISGWNVAGRPPYSTGFVYWPALLGIVLTSMIFARMGAKLAHRISSIRLRYVFVVFLCIVGTHLLSR